MGATRHKRLDLIDLARGLALVAMMIFHGIWDLAYFELLPTWVQVSAPFHGFGHLIAGAFFALVGAGIALAHQNGVQWRGFLYRLAQIVLAAGAITLVTFYAMPEGVITFGILHCIALSSLAALAFLPAPIMGVALVALAALVTPLVVSLPLMDHVSVQWLGLGTTEPLTNDWRPFLPWFGMVLAGLSLARFGLARGWAQRLSLWQANNRVTRMLTLGGRHSLAVYLIHQPVFLALLFLGTHLFGPDRIARDEQTFLSACESQCSTSAADAPFCRSVCGCVARDLKKANLWAQGVANQFSPRETQELQAIAQNCARATPEP